MFGVLEGPVHYAVGHRFVTEGARYYAEKAGLPGTIVADERMDLSSPQGNARIV